MMMFHGSQSAADSTRQIDAIIDHQTRHFLLVVLPTDLQFFPHVDLVAFVFRDSLDKENQAMDRAWIISGKRESQVIGIAGIRSDSRRWNGLVHLASRSGIIARSFASLGQGG